MLKFSKLALTGDWSTYLLLKLVSFVIGLTVEFSGSSPWRTYTLFRCLHCHLTYTYRWRNDDPCARCSPPVCSPILCSEDLLAPTTVFEPRGRSKARVLTYHTSDERQAYILLLHSELCN